MPSHTRRLLWRFGATLALAVAGAGMLHALARPATLATAARPSPTRSAAAPGPGRSPGVMPQRVLELDGWQYADTTGEVLGTAGPLRTFRVAVEDGVVENGVPVPVDEFTRLVDATLGDARSWVGAGTVRLRHVAAGAAANFTIYLATAPTAYRLCLDGGEDITIDGVPYTSCRVGSAVVINADRYTHGVPDYGAPLGAYRQYVINHEVGHWLRHGHVSCPGPGRPAPVMQQQTLGLQGCVANSWPLIDAMMDS